MKMMNLQPPENIEWPILQIQFDWIIWLFWS